MSGVSGGGVSVAGFLERLFNLGCKIYIGHCNVKHEQYTIFGSIKLDPLSTRVIHNLLSFNYIKIVISQALKMICHALNKIENVSVFKFYKSI